MSGASANLLRQVNQMVQAGRIAQLSDQQLLQRFAAQRDEAAFALVLRRHGPMVLGVCRRLLGQEQDAEDAFQAVFLILARRAGAIHQSDVGGWLYRVAYRLALRARANAGKHVGAACRAALASPARLAGPTEDPLNEVSWREVWSLVDEELQRLPAALRSAVVLHYLEGHTQPEAARLLGCSINTLRRRLERGRELLRVRLLARGLAPAAALTASLFADGVCTAAVPPPLAQTVFRTALGTSVAPAVAALAKSASPILNIGKVKPIALVLLAVVARGSLVGGWQCASEPLATTVENKTTPSLPRPAAKTVQIHGHVLGPDGRPKAGAKLFFLKRDEQPQHLGDTMADGTFTVALPNGSKGGWLIAQAEGCGIDFLSVSLKKTKDPIELHLVKDQVIRGRVVNTEGKPIAGARVTAESIRAFAHNSMDAFLVSWKQRPFNSVRPEGMKVIWSGELGKILAATTDADGRFALGGIGAERFARLRVRGSGIAESEQLVANRSGLDPKPYNQATIDFDVRYLLQGPELNIVAEAEKPIRGIVKAADTGKGRVGVVVRLIQREGGALLISEPQVRTDAEGRYEIRGASKARRYMIEVASDAATGYLGAQVWADDTPGYQPVTADIALKKGIIVTGKIIDQSTGKPMHGSVMVAPLLNNPFVKKNPAYESWNMPSTGDDFTFRVLTIPGHVLLMGGPHDWQDRLPFKQPLPDPKYPQYFVKNPDHADFYNPYGSFSPLQGNFCKVLDLKPDAEIVKQDIVLERASALPVCTQDTEGKPLSGVWVAGRNIRDWYPAIQSENAECAVYQLESGKPRLLVFYHPRRKLVGTLMLRGDEKPPIAAKLGPAAVIKGRLLDADGKPLAGIAVNVDYHQRTTQEIHSIIDRTMRSESDAAGAFTLSTVIPGQEFDLLFGQGKREYVPIAKAGDATIRRLKPGENRDLGGIRIKRKP